MPNSFHIYSFSYNYKSISQKTISILITGTNISFLKTHL